MNPYVEGLAETDSEDELPLHKSATKVEEVKEVEPEKNKSEMDEEYVEDEQMKIDECV